MINGEGINQKTFITTHRHCQQYGNQLGEGREWGWVEVRIGRKGSNNCNSVNNLKN